MASTGPLNPMLVTFAASGLVIALVGLYGVMSQFALQRRREMAVRIALGAEAWDVIRLMLGRGATLLLAGAVGGIAGASAAGFVVRRAFPELPILGVAGDTLLALVFIVVGVVACYLPSRRAARVNPVQVLRSE